MFCTHCGNKTQDTDRFCNKCGCAIIRMEPPVMEKIIQVAFSKTGWLEMTSTEEKQPVSICVDHQLSYSLFDCSRMILELNAGMHSFEIWSQDLGTVVELEILEDTSFELTEDYEQGAIIVQSFGGINVIEEE